MKPDMNAVQSFCKKVACTLTAANGVKEWHEASLKMIGFWFILPLAAAWRPRTAPKLTPWRSQINEEWRLRPNATKMDEFAASAAFEFLGHFLELDSWFDLDKLKMRKIMHSQSIAAMTTHKALRREAIPNRLVSRFAAYLNFVVPQNEELGLIPNVFLHCFWRCHCMR